MRTRRHPLSGAIYDVLEDGTISVTDRDGHQGIFDGEGRWLRGEVTHCDPHLCIWIAGPQLPPRLAVLPRFRPTAPSDDTPEETR